MKEVEKNYQTPTIFNSLNIHYADLETQESNKPELKTELAYRAWQCPSSEVYHIPQGQKRIDLHSIVLMIICQTSFP